MSDNNVTLISVAVITAIPGTIAAILAFLTHEKVEIVRKDVNSKMAELVRTTGEAEKAKGILEEKERNNVKGE